MKASILIVGHPFPEKIEFGADHSPTYDEGLRTLQSDKYAVVVAADKLPIQHSSTIKTCLEFLKTSRPLNPDTQTILVSNEASPKDLQRAINEFGLFKIISNFDSNPLQLAVREALEEYELIKQNEAFLALTQ